MCIAVPGNKSRLGGMKVPPAIISVFLGSELGRVVEEITSHSAAIVSSPTSGREGEKIIETSKLKMDTSDRNRTSPMALTGNRFEFRTRCYWIKLEFPTITDLCDPF